MNKKNNAFLRKAPFVKIIMPVAAGIVSASWVSVSQAAAIACFLILWSAALLFEGGRDKKNRSLYTWLAVMSFFFTAGVFNRPAPKLPAGERVTAIAQVLEKPTVRGRWMHTTAHVGYYRNAGKHAVDSDEGWEKVDERINLSVDTSYGAVYTGMQLAFKGWVNPIDTVGTSYGKLMKTRGIHNRIYLVPGNMVHVTGYVSPTPRYYSSVVQSKAVGKLAQLGIDSSGRAVLSAMVAGDRKEVDPVVRGDYNSSGTAHLLAVSGLHVGIVFVLVNIFLYLLAAAPKGHILKNVGAVLIIWVYAFVSGLSPSVVRAALMFSFAQAALASGATKNMFNIMLGSAVVMLAVDPNYLYDPSFLLSYVAVFAIIAFFPPVYQMVRTDYRFVNVLLSVVAVGFIASLGVAPLVSYFFGRVSLAGMLINPFVMVTAHIIVMGGVLWLLMPLGFGNAVFSWVLSGTVGVQNSLVAWSAGQEWLAFDGKMPLWGVAVCYVLLILGAVAVNRYSENKAKSLSLPVE